MTIWQWFAGAMIIVILLGVVWVFYEILRAWLREGAE